MNHSFKLKLLRDAIAEGSIPTLPEDALLSSPAIKRGSMIDSVNDVRVNYALRCAIPADVPVQVICDHLGLTLYVVMSSGRVYSAGGNYGSLGLGDGTADYGVDIADARIVDYSGKITFVSIEWYIPIALTDSGQLIWWGHHANYGMNTVGYGTYGGNPAVEPYSSAVPLDGITNITFQTIDIGEWCGCGLTIDGKLYSWGYGGLGTLGRGMGDTQDRFPTPGEVVHPDGGSRYWIYANTGHQGMCAIDDLGQLWTWGDNNEGQLGLGIGETTRYYDTPQKVGMDTDWVKCISSESRSLALKSDGSIWGMGYNYKTYWLNHDPADVGYHVLNPPDNIDSTPPITWCEHWSPIKISGDHVFTDFSTGYYHTIALKADGTAWGMGMDGYDGALGLGDDTDFVTDWTQITEGAWTLFSQIFCHYGNAIAIGTDNNIYFWGAFYALEEGNYYYPTRWQLPNQTE